MHSDTLQDLPTPLVIALFETYCRTDLDLCEVGLVPDECADVLDFVSIACQLRRLETKSQLT